MLIQCPSCHTTYRVSDSVITVPNPNFRCSRCKHIFVLGAKPNPNEAQETTVAPPSPPREEEERELSFSFPPRKEKTSSYEPPSPASHEKQPELRLREEEERWSLTRGPDENQERLSAAEEKRFSKTASPTEERLKFEEEWSDTAAEEKKGPSGAAFETEADRPASTTPYFILCAALVAIYSFLTVMHQAKPKALEPLLKTIPWLGSSILKNRYLRQGIVLQSLRPRFQRIQGNREVLVVSGVALNRNPVSVREVRVEGYIFSGEGKEVERQIITVGNAMSAKIIRDLTAQEIATLQRLSPPKRFEIGPAEPAAFVIVFLKSSAEIKSFGYRVVSAEEA